MLLGSRYKGLENLPIHESGSISIMTSEDLKSPWKLKRVAEANNKGKFFRTAAVNHPKPRKAPKGIDRLLNRTDEELELVAEMCGALVVDHEWGLYHTSDEDTPQVAAYGPGPPLRRRLRLPKDYILIAEVDYIEGVDARDILKDLSAAAGIEHPLTEGLGKYWKRGLDQCHLNDMFNKQFVQGRPSNTPDAEDQFWLVDIEPRFQMPAQK